MEPVAMVTGSELRENPGARFFALFAHLAENDGRTSDPQLQAFWLIALHDAEVLNGGHLQYFQNQGTKDVPRVIAALDEAGLPSHAEVLRHAIAVMNEKRIPPAKSLTGFSETAMSEPFGAQDRQYYELSPSVQEGLERYLGPKLEALVRVRGDA